MTNNPQPLDLDVNKIEKAMFAVHLRVGRFTTSWHMHPKHQLVYAEEGVLHLHTEQHHFLLPARHGAWVPSGCAHRIYSNSPELFLRTLYFSEVVHAAEKLGQLRIFPISNLAREMILYTQTWNLTDPPDRLEQRFFEMIRLMVPVWSHQSIPLILPSTQHPQLKRVTEYIDRHLAEPLRLDLLGEKYGFSGRTLLRLFKQELGMTFGTYLRVARVIRALELLTRPDTTVTEAAYAVGYDSPSSFSQTFSQLVGVNPREYAKNASS